MGFQAKRELLLQTGLRYSEASGQFKTKILDEFVLATGYDPILDTNLVLYQTASIVQEVSVLAGFRVGVQTVGNIPQENPR